MQKDHPKGVLKFTTMSLGFPHSSVGKESACSAGEAGSIPGLERSPGEGNGNPFQYSCLENPMDRGAWQATVHGVPRVRQDLATKLLLLLLLSPYHEINSVTDLTPVVLDIGVFILHIWSA